LYMSYLHAHRDHNQPPRSASTPARHHPPHCTSMAHLHAHIPWNGRALSLRGRGKAGSFAPSPAHEWGRSSAPLFKWSDFITHRSAAHPAIRPGRHIMTSIHRRCIIDVTLIRVTIEDTRIPCHHRRHSFLCGGGRGIRPSTITPTTYTTASRFHGAVRAPRKVVVVVALDGNVLARALH